MKINFSKKSEGIPEQEHHLHVRYGSAKRHFPRVRWYIILLLTLSPLIYFLFDTLYQAVNIIAPGYVSYQKVSIIAAYPGVVQDIYVKPGDFVKQNQLLALLKDPLLQTQYEQIRSRLSTLGGLAGGEQFDVLTQLYEKLDIAEQNLVFIHTKLQIAEALNRQQELGFNEFLLAQQQYVNAEYQLHDIEIAIAQENQNRIKELRVPNSSLNQEGNIKDQLKQLKVQLDQLKVKASYNGKIISEKISTGQYVVVGTPLFEQTTAANPYIDAYLDPKYGKYTHVGKKVTIHFPDGKSIPGKVVKEPELTERLPEDLSGAMTIRSVMILVKIQTTEPIPPDQDLEGLPVKVYF